jgi:hypothetical protein
MGKWWPNPIAEELDVLKRAMMKTSTVYIYAAETKMWATQYLNLKLHFLKKLENHTIDRQRLQHTHQNLHTTDQAKKPIINT